ncbi:MAG: membrane protein [Saprospiraceae bacterium]|nr:MAG: membrane protein [Saprospiraceae bacterium]
MKKYQWIIILVNLIILLALFNSSVLKKEATLSDGTLLLLELAPVDPRSLIQGDYMRLRYQISEDISYDSISRRGFCVVKPEANGIAKRVRLQDSPSPVYENEFPIRYNATRWNMNIGAESFFFQEGEAAKFENAKYGGLRVDGKGNSILVGLYDEHLEKLNK